MCDETPSLNDLPMPADLADLLAELQCITSTLDTLLHSLPSRRDRIATRFAAVLLDRWAKHPDGPNAYWFTDTDGIRSATDARDKALVAALDWADALIAKLDEEEKP